MANARSSAAACIVVAGWLGCAPERPAPRVTAPSGSSAQPVVASSTAAASSAPASSALAVAADDAGSNAPGDSVADAKVTARGRGQERRASTQAACAACKGDWGPHGMAGVVGCLCATPDGGKPCKSPLDCEASCTVDARLAQEYSGVRCGPSGCTGGRPFPPASCARVYVDFGCHGRVVQFDSPTQGTFVEVQFVCLD